MVVVIVVVVVSCTALHCLGTVNTMIRFARIKQHYCTNNEHYKRGTAVKLCIKYSFRKLAEVELNASSSRFMELYGNILQLYIKRRLVLIKTAPSHLHLIMLESLYYNCSVSHDSHSWLSGSSMLIHLRAGVKTLQGCTTYSLMTSAVPRAVSFVIPKRILGRFHSFIGHEGP